MNNSRLLILKAVTPIHVGASEGSGIADMPIQREASTNIPKIESSVFKGALKDYFSKSPYKKESNLLFSRSEIGGQLSFTDLKLLFFPVKSSKNIFSLISCPYIIERFLEDTILYNVKIEGLEKFSLNCRNVHDNLALVINNSEENIYLGEYLFKIRKIGCDELFKNFKIPNDLLNRVVIISNENFKDFVSYYTEVVTRNRINKETGTSKSSGLFTQEYLSDESIFYGVVNRFSDIFDDKDGENAFKKLNHLIMSKQKNKLKIGGSTALEKGIVKIICWHGGDIIESKQ